MERYELDEERREGVDEAIARRAAQSDLGERDRELENPAGHGTVSEQTEREMATGGHGHGGALDLEVERMVASAANDRDTGPGADEIAAAGGGICRIAPRRRPGRRRPLHPRRPRCGGKRSARCTERIAIGDWRLGIGVAIPIANRQSLGAHLPGRALSGPAIAPARVANR